MFAADSVVAGRYRLVDRIGSGGMGEVWRARDGRLERDVAVKLVDLANNPDPLAEARFRREGVAAAGLSHPNVVTVYDAGMDGQIAFLVMELLRGQTLSAVIRERGSLPMEVALPLARAVAEALAALHRLGIIHRDVKPANVMVTPTSVKVLDFGIAQLAPDSGHTLTTTATTMGTAAYMSPEQASGTPVTTATDWYAFGCVLMAMLTGQPPFVGPNPIGVAAQQISGSPPRLRQRRPDLPQALDELIAGLLSKDPALRPGAQDVLGVLDQRFSDGPAATRVLPQTEVGSGGATMPPGLGATRELPSFIASPTPAYPPPSVPSYPAPQPGPGGYPPAPGRPRRRRGWLWVLGATVAIALIATAVLLGMGRPGAQPSTQPTATGAKTVESAQPTQNPPSEQPTEAPSTDQPSESTTKSSAPQTQNPSLDLAMQTMDIALASLSGSTDAGRKAKQDLQSEWAKVTKLVQAGNLKQVPDKLNAFSTKVDTYGASGAINAFEQELLSQALALVRQAL